MAPRRSNLDFAGTSLSSRDWRTNSRIDPRGGKGDRPSSLAKVVRPIEIESLWRPQLRNPDDEMVLEAAINGRADAIVTFNIRDFAVGAARFGIRAMTPSEALVHLSKPNH